MKMQEDNKLIFNTTNSLKKHHHYTGSQSFGFIHLLQSIGKGLAKPFNSIRAMVYQGTGVKLSSQPLPWIKVLVIVMAGVILLYKDMNFNINLTAPTAGGSLAVIADQDDKKETRPVALEDENEFAPIAPSGLMDEKTKAYIERFEKTAVTEMDVYGIPASIKLAQGLIESRAGESRLAVNNNNHFGMKCFSRSCKKGHCTNHSDDSHKDFFRNYDSAWESWRAHSKLLANGKYKKLAKHGKDYKAWAVGLQKAGYATDKNYARKLIGVIERYKLYKYDDL